MRGLRNVASRPKAICERSRAVAVWASLLLTSFVCIAPNWVGAQSQDLVVRRTDDDWHFRYDLFQMLFEQKGLRPIRDWSQALAEPQRTVMVVVGNIPLRAKGSDMSRFINAGGAILVASDRNLPLTEELTISSGPVLSYTNDDQYQNHLDCIRIRDLEASSPLMKGVRQLVVNRSGWIRRRVREQSAWEELAKLPNSTQWSNRGKPIVVALDPKRTNESRFVVAADHSLFTNGMMWHGDNALFAINLSTYLCTPGRDQLLFVVDNSPSSSYLVGPLADQLPLPSLDGEQAPELGLDEMLMVANSVVEHVQDTDVMNELLTDQPRRMRESVYRRGLLNALAVAMVCFALYKLATRARKPQSPKQPDQQRRVGGSRPALEHNPEARARTALTLATNFCQELTSSTQKNVWRDQLSPAAIADRGIHLSKADGNQLTAIVSMAMQNRLQPISLARLIEIGQTIASLRASLLGHAQPETLQRT